MAYLQEAGPSGRGEAQRGVVPTRRALFPTRLQGADQWSVAASRNLDAPEMGSPPNSDDEEEDEDGDDSSSDSSSEVSRSPLASCLTASTIMQFSIYYAMCCCYSSQASLRIPQGVQPFCAEHNSQPS